MYNYEYVPVPVKTGFLKSRFDEHREIIDRYARDGWRFVAAIPTEQRGYGMIYELELVFEKKF